MGLGFSNKRFKSRKNIDAGPPSITLWSSERLSVVINLGSISLLYMIGF